MGRAEFIGLMAMMSAMTAFSIDAMLPAMPEIAAELSPDAPNYAQLIITSFVAGMGLGTFFTGPLSDAFGRKPVVYVGCALYILGAALAWFGTSLELVLAARFLQGLGMAGPRIVSMAIIRDLFAGRQMAKLVSIVMIIFTLAPAIAPLLGSFIIDLTSWRGIFGAFILFCLILLGWFALRLDETLAPEARRPFRPKLIWSGFKEMTGMPMVMLSLAVQTLAFGVLFGTLSSVQPIYDITFGRAESFPFWFGVVSLMAGSASFFNALLVVRLGMRFLVMVILWVQLAISALMILLTFMPPADPYYFFAFVFWQFSLFFMAGMTLGNLNALAMEPLGHIAGTAASVLMGLATVGAIIIAIPMGLLFDGTPRPMALLIFALCLLAVFLVQKMRKLERVSG